MHILFGVEQQRRIEAASFLVVLNQLPVVVVDLVGARIRMFVRETLADMYLV